MTLIQFSFQESHTKFNKLRKTLICLNNQLEYNSHNGRLYNDVYDEKS